MVTPLDGPESLDRAGLERLIEHVIDGGVHGIFVLGTTGEGPALSYRLRRELIERTCVQVAGWVPVLVGITDTSYSESCALAAHAKKAGADAVVTAPPFYFAVSQGDLFRLVQLLSAKVELPLYLYNMPSLTKCCFAPETVMRAAELPNVWGLKDSSGELGYLRSIAARMQDRPDFTLLVGPEETLLRRQPLPQVVRLALPGSAGGRSGGCRGAAGKGAPDRQAALRNRRGPIQLSARTEAWPGANRNLPQHARRALCVSGFKPA
jgi:2-dehydro-3-deoxy-D-pentonate aldolase